MATRRERRERLKKKYYEGKYKAWLLFAILVVYIILFGILVTAIAYGNLNITILFIILIIIWIPVSIFINDQVLGEYQ